MWPYFILFALLAFGAFTSGNFARGDAKQPLLIVSTALLTIFVGLRLQVGGDWYTYLRLFRFMSSTSLDVALRTTDPGYALLNWIAGQLGADIWAVNLVCAIIFTAGLRKFALSQPHPQLAMLVAVPYLVIAVAMGYTRQSVALGFIMYAIVAYKEQRYVKLALFMLLAAAFHKSAIIIVPFFALALAKQGAGYIVGTALLAAAAYFAFLRQHVDLLFINYMGAQSAGAGVRVLMNLLPAALLLGFRRRLGFDPREYRLWVVFSIAAVLCAVAYLISPSSTAIDRVALYVIPLQIAVLAKIPDLSSEGPQRSIAGTAIVVAYCLSVEVVWLNFGQVAWAWLPYRNYVLVPNQFVPKYHRY